MYKYRIFGLNVVSEMALHCYGATFDAEDLYIGFTDNKADICCTREPFPTGVYSFKLEINDGSGIICYDGAKRIDVYYRSVPDLQQAVIPFLMGAAFGFVFFLRKNFVLHGSCVKIGGKSAVFTGSSGAGKSSIAAGFTRSGGKIISDDISRIELNAAFPFVYPSFPAHKLWLHTIRHLGINDPIAFDIKGKRDKYIIRADNDAIFSDEIVPVSAIIRIRPAPRQDVVLVREKVSDALKIVLGNIFTNYTVNYPDLTNDLFSYIIDICDKIPVYSLYRPAGRFTVDEQVSVVMNEVFHKDFQ